MPGVHVARGALSRELCAAIVPQLEWKGSLGPAGPGNRCTHGVSWCAGEERRGLFGELWQQLLAARVVPLEFGQAQHWRAWASSTPAGVPIERHAHDGDVVLAIYLAAPDDAEPLEFVRGGPLFEPILPRDPSVVEPWDPPAAEVVESVIPEPGLVLMWPSSLEHRVPAGERRAGERVCAAFNVTLRRDA